jgi:peptide deformylase
MPDSHPDPDTATASTGRVNPASDTGRFVPPYTSRWPVHWRVPTTGDLEALEAGYRRGLLPAHAPLLHEPVPPLAVGSAEAKEVAQRLYEAVRREAEAGNPRMVGLAAPQIGIAARAFLFDPREDVTDPSPPVEALRCVVNPGVEVFGDDLLREMEGCLSAGRIRGWVNRAARVRLSGHTSTGEPIDEVLVGLAARVVQHETDHLDGILFPQRITDDYDLLWSSAEQDEQFLAYVRAARGGETPHWNTHLPRDQWEAIRTGVAVFGSLTEPQEQASVCPAPPAGRGGIWWRHGRPTGRRRSTGWQPIPIGGT